MGTERRRVVVIGAGMVAHRFVEGALARAGDDWRITVVGEERALPYDRVGLTSFFSGRTFDELSLDAAPFADPRVEIATGERVIAIDRRGRTVRTSARREIAYDDLVLATGSYAARPAIDGAHLPGCFVYRTLDDLTALTGYLRGRRAELGRPLVGRVVGGGLLGLEAAGALEGLDVATEVIHSGAHLMSGQLDRGAGEVLGVVPGDVVNA